MGKVIENWNMFYPYEWNIDEVCNYAGFVYLIQFPDSGTYYIGVKQVYKGIKDFSKLKSTSIESDWKRYCSSSKTVKEMIESGEKYRKSILWCFKTIQEAMLVESTLIGVFGTDHSNINKAIMVKTRLKKDYDEQRKVLQRIMGNLM
ncbi:MULTISPECIES: hypothetical protein [Pantoea]|uniref:hypothetical protein n=1 Tax=Pantoea TaxID=53335 RepID=UPI001FF0A85C|nr:MULTISPECIES: hypothetical protein [Pantoea]MDI3365979.1 hypothetical protein [Pantoea sp. V108_6]